MGTKEPEKECVVISTRTNGLRLGEDTGITLGDCLVGSTLNRVIEVVKRINCREEPVLGILAQLGFCYLIHSVWDARNERGLFIMVEPLGVIRVVSRHSV